LSNLKLKILITWLSACCLDYFFKIQPVLTGFVGGNQDYTIMKFPKEFSLNLNSLILQESWTLSRARVCWHCAGFSPVPCHFLLLS